MSVTRSVTRPFSGGHERSLFPLGPAGRVSLSALARLVVVAVSLAGIIAMHGLAVADHAGLHQSPITSAGDPGTRHMDDSGGTNGPDDRATAPAARPDLDLHQRVSDAGDSGAVGDTAVVEPAGKGMDHLAMASCVAVLLSLVGLAVLGLRRINRSGHEPMTMIRRGFAATSARAPPKPIFLLLCVFRT